jgi:hypothetical protein
MFLVQAFVAGNAVLWGSIVAGCCTSFHSYNFPYVLQIFNTTKLEFSEQSSDCVIYSMNIIQQIVNSDVEL